MTKGLVGCVLVGVLSLIGAVASRVAAQSAGAEWGQWTVAVWYDGQGRSALVSTLEEVERAGWDVRFVTARQDPWNGTVTYDVLARRGPVASQPADPAYTYGTSCPGYPIPPFAGALCYGNGGWR